jgi:hypothetical protein
MAGLYADKLRRVLGVVAGACALLGRPALLAAETPDPTPPEDAAPSEPSREPLPEPKRSPRPSPGAPTHLHDPSLGGGAGTPPPAPPITVRPRVAPAPGDPSGREVEPELLPSTPALVPSWTERRVSVVLVPSRSGVSLRIRPLGSPTDEERCGNRGCIASVRPGQYEISVIDRGSDTGSRELELTRSERLVLTPPDESARTTGLVLGVGGTVLFGVGVVLSVAAYSSSLSECDDRGNCDHTPAWLGPLGITAGVTGGIAMPIGWVLFGNNLRPRVERTPVDPLTLRDLAATARLSARIERADDRVDLAGSFSF